MMSNRRSQWPFEYAADLGQGFAHAAESPEKRTQGISNKSVAETAAAEIENRIAHDDALGKHDQRWQSERDKLAHSPEFGLEPPGMGSNPRELQDEYAKRRGQWEQGQDGIDRAFENANMEIRDEGITLGDAFADVSDIEVEPDNGLDFDQGPDMGGDNDGVRSL